MNITQVLGELQRLWDQYSGPVIIGVGVVALVLLVWIAVRFWRNRTRSKVVSTIAAVVVMAWTSEGLLAVALDTFHIPTGFAVMVFFVFEAMLLAAAMQAEEHRTATGVPGPAGQYAFLLAATSGIVASFGANGPGLVFLRVALPLIAVGQWWIALTAERSTDTDDMKAERQRRKDDRAATWAVTPRTVLIRLGLMKPGKSSTTTAQREQQITRMVVAADLVAADGWRAKRARKRLRRLSRTADPAMIEAVAERVRQAVDAERLMVPDRERPRYAGQSGTDRSSGTARRQPTDRRAESGTAPSVPSGTALRALPESESGTVGQASGTGHRAVAGQRAPGVRESSGSTSGAGRRAPSGEEERQSARDIYRASLSAGDPLSGAQLARMYEKTDPKWGVRRIAEVRDQMQQEAPAARPGDELAPVGGAQLVDVNQEDEEQ
jgi:hypothetical protein